MSTNLQDITLQSMDGVLTATNDAGHLVYPMLHLNRQPTPADAQGWDRVLVFVEGGTNFDVNPASILLNEDNNYFQSLYIRGDGAWSISGVNTDRIQVESSSGQMLGAGNARIDITKAPALNTQGSYTCSFTVILATAVGSEMEIPVTIEVSNPLQVNGEGNGETLTISLNNTNQYTELLTVERDREWTLENVDTNKISVSPVSGNGASLQDFISTLTVTKSPALAAATAATTFQVVSLFQRVNVTVNITLTITGEFVDPLFGEEGVSGTGNLYIYL